MAASGLNSQFLLLTMISGGRATLVSVLIVVGEGRGISEIPESHVAGVNQMVAAFQRGLIIAAGLSLPLMGLSMIAGPILIILGQDPGVAALSQAFFTPYFALPPT